MKRSIPHAVLLPLCLVTLSVSSSAAVITIVQPDATYTASTHLLNVTAPESSNITSLSDGVVTATFSEPLQVATVPTNWFNWGAPPAVETATPRVMITPGVLPSVLTITFSQALTEFGLEAMPDAFGPTTMTANFYNGSTNIGTIQLTPDGGVGALLFAAISSIPITSVDITAAGTDFAIAQLRYVTVPPEPYQISYAANLAQGDSYINLTNAGTLAGADPAGRICANVYTFDPAEEMISCCSCLVTPNGLKSLSVRNDLISNTLTPGVPTSVVVKLLSTTPVSGACDATTATTGNQVRGMRAWRSTLHPLSGSPAVYGTTETPFSKVELSETELSKLTSYCGFIQSNGSGFGICRSCRNGALGGDTQ